MGISTFYGLNLGLSTLEAMKQAQSVVGNNMANAGTPGYVRERSNMQEQVALPTTGNAGVAGRLGQGVTVQSIQRVTNQFINRQDRANQGTSQMYSTLQQNLSQIQSILNEPSSHSMQNVIDQFFQSWQTLSTNPTNTAARQSVISEAQTVGQTFQTITHQLEAMQSNLSQTVNKQIGQFNQYAQEVATLNQQIVSVANQGQNPNTLEDQRGLLLDKMSKLANITYNQQTSSSQQNNGTEPKAGAISVSIVNGSGSTKTTFQVVSGGTSTALPTGMLPANQQYVGAHAAPVSTASGFNLSAIQSGAIAGNVKSLDSSSQLLAHLDSFLTSFSSQVNTRQSKGFGLSSQSGQPAPAGPALFEDTQTSAGNVVLKVNSIFTGSGGTNYIAAAGNSKQPGDNSNALAMVQLQNLTGNQGPAVSYLNLASNTTATQSFSGNGTFDQGLASIVSQVGVEAAGVNSQAKTANALAQQSSNLRQSLSGVNQDAQATKMVQYQNTYNAAAKFISVFNQMLQTLISEV